MEALREVVGSRLDARELVLEISGSWHVRALADLYGYDVACSLYAQRLDEGRGDLAPGFARALWAKAFIHEALHDSAGALACWAAGADLESVILREQPRSDGAAQLAHCLCNMARVLEETGDAHGALTTLDQGIGLYREIVAADPESALRRDLATALGNQGQQLFFLRGPDDAEALSALDEAIAILGGVDGDRALGERARCRMSRAIARHGAERAARAGARRPTRSSCCGAAARSTPTAWRDAWWRWCNRDRGRRIVDAAARPRDRAAGADRAPAARARGLADVYASCLLKRAALLSEESGAAASVVPLAQAIESLEPLVYREGMLALVGSLVDAYLAMAAAVAIAQRDAQASCELEPEGRWTPGTRAVARMERGGGTQARPDPARARRGPARART